MKTLRFLGMALIAVLVSVGFSGCGGSDDDVDNGSSSASFEGEWHVTTLKGYEWDSSKNAPDMNNITFDKTFGRTKDFETWVISKKGNDRILVKLMSDNDAKYHYTGKLVVQETEYTNMSGNEYYKEEKGNITDRLIFKNISSNQLTIEYVEYYSKGVDYCVYTLTR